MTRKSEKQARHIQELLQKGVSIEDIADSGHVSPGTIKKCLNVILNGNKSYEDYLRRLAENKAISQDMHIDKAWNIRNLKLLKEKFLDCTFL